MQKSGLRPQVFIAWAKTRGGLKASEHASGWTDAQRPFVRPGWLPDPSLMEGLGGGAGTEALLPEWD